MKKRVRRILSFILTAVMIFALLPVIGNPMVVKAEDTPAEHVAHDEQCSAEETDCKYHKDWTKISTWTELKSLGEKGGSGYLVNNIEISETFTIESGKTVNLCLNGYSITQTEDYTHTITVRGTLNLYDKKGDSGKITHANGKKGDGVEIEDNGTFTMNGGTISGNNATWGGGVINFNGSFTMNGGTISGNDATNNGGGVDNYYGTFTMTEGTIKDNTASKKGSGVYSCYSFVKEGGDIDGSMESDAGTLFTVTFNSNGKPNNTITQYVLPNKETNLAPNKFSYDNHKFVCWNTMADCTGVPYQDEEKTIINSNLVLYARWIESYDVTFKVNNGSWSDVLTDVKEVNYWKYADEDKTLVLNASDIPTPGNPAKGYKAGGWDAEPDTVNNLSENKEYTYTFAPIEYTVNYDSNGGEGTMLNQDRKYDDKAPLTANTFTLEGYKFNGWNTEADGSGTPYKDEEVNNLSSTEGNIVTLFAQWQANKYTVKFDANGGVETMDNQDRKYDDKVPLTANVFTFEGKTFNGWNTEANGSGTPYKDEEVNNLSSTEGDIVTLFAQWQANKYTVNYDSNGGVGTMDNQDRKYDDKVPLTTNVFTYEGKTFNGWNTAADGSGTPYKDEEVGNLSITDNDKVTLYAQWTTDTFTISWKNYDGTVLETDKNVAYGSTPSYDGETPVRAKEGNKEYTFTGWTPEVDTVKGAATYTATYSEEVVEQTEPETPQNPTEPETPEEPEEEIPEKDWLDDLRLALNIAAEPDSEKTVEYSGDFALPYEIMNFLVNHPDITFVYHVTYEGQEYTITIPAGKAVAYADTSWYGPLWLLANYGGNNAPTGAKGNGTYIVKAGDTLTGISVRLGVTIQYLVDKNGIKNPDYIVEGQELIY